jgi:hypothetical protein
MGVCDYSISHGTWHRVAAAHGENCGSDPAGSRTQAEVIMKSMLFILIAQLHSGGTQTVAAYPSLEQCRDALKVATTNVAADYTCSATPVEGRWSQKDSRYLMARE